MSFEELLREAGSLTPEQAESELRELMHDPRFRAVLRMLANHREALVVNASSLELAGSPSAASLAAHQLGGIDAIFSFESILRGIYEAD